MSQLNVDKVISLSGGGSTAFMQMEASGNFNFDAGTLEMDGVGERPWDRAFFRDTALALLEKGKAGKGSKIMLAGFGVGFSWVGTILTL